MILGRGRCTPVTGRRGRPSSFLVWANTGNHPQLSNHTTPFDLMRRERVASATFVPAVLA